MNRIISPKSIAAAGLVLGAMVAASAAHARSDVYLSIGVQPQYGYVQPAPVYVQPRPVYVAPRPVYVQPQPYYGYGHGWERRGPYGDRDGDGIANIYDRRDGHRYHRGHGHRYGPHGDLDRDGVSNQHDRDRDGDGIRNRHDRAPDNWRYR